MEKWLEAFARGLLIQKDTEEGRKTDPASEEQIEAFKEALKANLEFQSTCRYLGDTITYDYRRGTVRGRNKWENVTQTDSPNGNLFIVLAVMPRLPDGENYAFPTPTVITFRMIDKAGTGEDFAVINVCDWIQQNL